MSDEKLGQVDFFQFWTRFKKPDGRLSGATFDDELFAQMFGNEAAAAYSNWAHYTGNVAETPEEQAVLQAATVKIRNSGRVYLEIGLAYNGVYR